MPQCPDCGCDLPSFQTLCSRCFEARYAEVGRPKSFTESIRQFGSNPRRWEAIENRITQPCWLAWCFAVIGLVVDWRLAFESFGGRNSASSESVLYETALIVIWIGALAAVVVRVTRGARWRNLGAVFLLFSLVVYHWLSVDWIVHPR